MSHNDRKAARAAKFGTKMPLLTSPEARRENRVMALRMHLAAAK
jgi:hypothetical protein